MDRPALYRALTARLPRLARAVRGRLRRRATRFPAILSLELTNHCNARCIMCPRQAMTRPRGFMAPELYERLLAGAARHQEHLHLVQPFLFGESLLHPEFDRLLALTRERLPRPRLYLSTNAALLDERRARAILAARTDKLNVDIDGLSAPVAEGIRRGVRLAVVEENVARFLALRRELRGGTRLRVSIIRMRENAHEIEAFVAHWRRRADDVQTVDLNSWLASVPVGADGAGGAAAPAFDFPCRHPYEELAVAWDGRATLCCLDFDLRHPVGDATRDDLATIWRGPALRAAREKLEAGDYAALPICRRCNAARFQQRGLWRFLWQA